MKVKNKVLRDTMPLLEQEYGRKAAGKVMGYALKRQKALCTENKKDPKAVRTHTEGKIFPCIALYEGMKKAGIQAEEAVRFLDRAYSIQAEPQADMMRKMMKLPKMYRLMPRMFAWVAVHQFGEKAGFRAVFYPVGKTRVKFDMTKCLYCDVCRKYGYGELIPCFCHTDDVTNGNIHPKLCWNRTKIMGDGGDVCDFDLFVKE